MPPMTANVMRAVHQLIMNITAMHSKAPRRLSHML